MLDSQWLDSSAKKGTILAKAREVCVRERGIVSLDSSSREMHRNGDVMENGISFMELITVANVGYRAVLSRYIFAVPLLVLTEV